MGIEQPQKRLHESIPTICEICKIEVKNCYVVTQHEQNAHSMPRACAVCGGMFKQIKVHMQTVCAPESEKKYQCKDCDKGFRDKARLGNHIMNVHIKSKPYQCRFGCENRYNDTSNRLAHEKRRHKEGRNKEEG